MAFTIIAASGPVISAKISGKLSKSEVSQMQAAALAAIRRCGKISALFILDKFNLIFPAACCGHKIAGVSKGG